MINTLKALLCVIFSVLLVSASNATNNYLYSVVAHEGWEVVGCPIDPGSGKLAGNCFGNNEAHKFDLWEAIASHPTGNYMYLAGEFGITVCSINKENGNLHNCKEDPTIKLGGITGIAVDPLFKKQLYYITKKSLAACKIDKFGMSKCHECLSNLQEDSSDEALSADFSIASIDVEARAREMLEKLERFNVPNSCDLRMSNLRGASSIALSPNGTFVYITLKKSASVMICHIQDDGTLGECNTNSAESQIIEPEGIAIDPNGEYAYIIDDKTPNGGLVSCKLTKGGSALEECKHYLSAPGFTGDVKSITLSKDGYYSYISYASKHDIVKCSMLNGEYSHCRAAEINLRSVNGMVYH